jgi:hypothetical protein
MVILSQLKIVRIINWIGRSRCGNELRRFLTAEENGLS